MKLGIVVPWRHQESRAAAFVKTIERLSQQFPDSTIYCSDKPGERFSISGARNKGCLEAIEDGCDTLLVVDADMLLEKDAIERAIEKSKLMVSVCLPYTVLNRMNEELSTSVINDEILFEETRGHNTGYTVTNQIGGAYVMQSSTFLRLNGWDERFLGWGFEDDAFAAAHSAILGKTLDKVQGYAVTFYHLDRDQANLEDNRQRYYSYLNKTRKEMVEITEGNMND